MPIYEYECRKCGLFDYSQSIADRPLSRCPKCRSKVSKLISATAFHLKGGGWYADGYDRKDRKKSDATGDTSSEANAPEGPKAAQKNEPSGEAKPKKTKEKTGPKASKAAPST